MRFNVTENKEENFGSRCGLMQQRIKKKIAVLDAV